MASELFQGDTLMPLLDAIVAQADDLRAIRRDIHAHPELAFEETRTADLVAERLQAWGIPIHRGLGKTGVVGIIQRSEEHTSELQSLMRSSYAVFRMKKNNNNT